MNTCPHCGQPLGGFSFTEDDFKSVSHLLPPTALELCTLVGFKTAFRIMQDFGGQRLLLSKNVRKDGKQLFNRLAEQVGLSAAEKLTHAFGAFRCFSVPKCKKAVAELKHRKVRMRFDEICLHTPYNAAINQIACEFGLTERWVTTVLKQADDDMAVTMPVYPVSSPTTRERLPRQNDLFAD